MFFFKKNLNLCGFLLFAFLLSPGAHAQQSVRFGVNVPYAPFEYSTPNGELEGFDIELGNALCKVAQLQCTWQSSSWDSLIPSLMARKIDAILSTMTITEARKQQVLFSDPYIFIPSAWYTKKQTPQPNFDASQLHGQSIGVQRGTMQDAYVSEKYGTDNTIRRYASLEDVVMDLQAGRLNYAMVDFPTGETNFVFAHPTQFAQVGALIHDKNYFSGAAIAFRQRDKQLAQLFNDALATLKKEGIYQALIQKYFKDKNL